MRVFVVLIFFAGVAGPKLARRRLQAGAARVAAQVHEDKHAQRRRRASRHAQGQDLALHPQAGLLPQRGIASLVSYSGAKQKELKINNTTTKMQKQIEIQKTTKDNKRQPTDIADTHIYVSLLKVVLLCLYPSLHLSSRQK